MAQGYRNGTEAGFDLDGWRLLVDGFREAVVVLDPDGVARLANSMAAALFPDVRVGERAPEPGGRRQDLGGGWTAWYRDADELLDRLSRRLVELTDRAAAVRAVVEVAPADHPVVVVPGARGRLEWWRRTPAGDVAVSRTTRQVADGVPGLAAVLAREVDHARLDEPGEGPWGLPPGVGPPALAVPLTDGAALVCFRCSCDVPMLRRFAERAAAALEAGTRFGEQQRTVEALRSGLLPSSLPSVAGVRLAAVFEPAHRRAAVGGDFYDVHPREDGSAAFVLGDVAGNGIEAAVHSGRVRQSLHTLLLVEQRPAQLLHLLNAALRAAGSRLFTTAVVGNLVPVQSGGLRLALATGGHPVPLVLRADGRVDEVPVHGGIVGVLPEVRFQQVELSLAPGESLLLYSDGVTEARSHRDRRELFGDERLRAALAACAGEPAEAIAEHLRRVVFEWLGDTEHDDLTLLLLQATH
ncbi:PP2C family protein-serine/threonine phosphatase [Saccharothrix coeruleofusca]|uniref:Histidine kinase n=1 Tax=Saccharothrix coeruleofusca TaxID=33919 RepID=A0A918EFF9_9PSEU|nr:PP2C family protein-serine/threonine phosphatase [Saccharothrix coeruleofusca]MBP2337674.1 serine phosphatase RsbU (regulator of sigma subunit) [Saccharothrix coeruleofusca]GGP64250.1 histidine kinase [Saccharothrix coeruleofusca]